MGGLVLYKFLLWSLAATLRRHVGQRPFIYLEERLLYAFTADIPRDRRVIAALAGRLIDLVNVDNAFLGPVNIKIRRLDQAQQDIFNIFTDIPGFGQGSRISDAEWHIQDFCQRL